MPVAPEQPPVAAPALRGGRSRLLGRGSGGGAFVLWHFHVHRECIGSSESTNLSRSNLGPEVREVDAELREGFQDEGFEDLPRAAQER